jgi:hypothetical protein
MQHNICDQPLNALSKAFKSQLAPVSSLSKSKLDKAQARRLKMPKRNRSAYFLFSMDVRAKLKADNSQLTPLETQALVSKYWKELSVEEKEKYELRAKEEKLEYLVAMDKFYSNLTPETLAKSKTNKPKKPCSAYAHFVRDIKTSLKQDNPRLIMQEILHIVSDKWKNLDEKTRAIYEEKARVDKEHYMNVTRNTHGEAHESPKKLSEVVKCGKRSQRYSGDEHLSKQLKTENISVKSETPIDLEETSYSSVKLEENKESSYISESPVIVKNDSDGLQEFNDQFRASLMYRPEANVALKMNNYYVGQQIPLLNEQFSPNSMNMNGNQRIYNDAANYDQLRQGMMAKLSLMRMVQSQRGIEEAIMRKIMEVKNLQAQRMMYSRDFFLASNTGGF